MMNCTDVPELTSNAVFLTAVASQAVAALLSAIISVLVSKQCGYLYFHPNCKILIVAMLMLYIVHSIIVTILQTTQFVRYLTFSDPCEVALPPVVCLGLRLPATACMISFTSLLFAIFVERTIASWKCREYATYGPHIGYALTALCIIASLSSTYWTASVTDLNERSPFCSTANSRTADRVALLSFSISGLNLVTLIGILALLAFNGFAAKRRGFDLKTSYQLRENAYIIRIMLPLSVFQASCYAIFSLSSGIISIFRDRLSLVEYKTLFALTYIIPFYTMVSPVLVWFIIRWSQQMKAAELKKITTRGKNDEEIYFRTYSKMWRSAPVHNK